MNYYGSDKVRSYKSYKAEQFNKKLEKMRNLLNSIDDTSLKPEDKVILKSKLKELFT
jgi:hypothetical protein